MLKHFWFFGALVTTCILVQFFYSIGHPPEKAEAKAYALLTAWGMSFLLSLASGGVLIFLAAQRRHPEIRRKMVSLPMLASVVVSFFALSVTSAMNGLILMAVVSLVTTLVFTLRYFLALEQAYAPSVPPPRFLNALAVLGLFIAIPILWALAH